LDLSNVRTVNGLSIEKENSCQTNQLLIGPPIFGFKYRKQDLNAETKHALKFLEALEFDSSRASKLPREFLNDHLRLVGSLFIEVLRRFHDMADFDWQHVS
jgi:hypothetical protein